MSRRYRSPSNAKPERNKLLFDYYNQHPELTLEQIGRFFNISRARVLQIVQAQALKEGTNGQKA